jgi:ring-1,2-phenylacetyl-CoA epoxidase subunit PaaC
MSEPLHELLLTLADDEFVLGFWDSEWTGIAPTLEEDVAASSIAQDEIGHAKAWYELLAARTGADPDAIAFGREPAGYRHAALLNHPRTDWAFTVARRVLYEWADAVRLESLAGSSDAEVAGLARKMRREETYHLLHWHAWLRRLANGGVDARGRLVAALELLAADAESLFESIPGEDSLVADGILPEPMSVLRDRWRARLRDDLDPLGITLPEQSAAPPPRGTASKDFDWLWGEFTSVARSGAGTTW